MAPRCDGCVLTRRDRRPMRTPISDAFQNFQTPDAVDEEDQPAIVLVDVVALAALRARRRLGHVMRDLFWRMRMRNIDDTEALREPGEGHFRAPDLLDGLMTAAVIRVIAVVETFDLIGADRDRMLLVGDVDHPHEGGQRRLGPLHVLVGDDRELPPEDVEGDADAGMRRTSERRAPVEARDPLRLRHVVDVEDMEAALPIARVKAIALA